MKDLSLKAPKMIGIQTQKISSGLVINPAQTSEIIGIPECINEGIQKG